MPNPTRGGAGRYERLASALIVGGMALTALAGRRSRAAAILGGALVLGGAFAKRWSIFTAGFQSASDPKYTVVPQRERLRSRGGAEEGDAWT